MLTTEAPPTRLVPLLSARRDAGEPFEAAWSDALELAVADDPEAGEWRMVLAATEPEWRSAFAGEPPRRRELRLLTLAEEPRSGVRCGPVCERCGGDVPPANGPGRRKTYCSRRCQRKASESRVAAA
jgi:hypothetical protein